MRHAMLICLLLATPAIAQEAVQALVYVDGPTQLYAGPQSCVARLSTTVDGDPTAVRLTPWRPMPLTPAGACTSQAECEKAADQACKDAGKAGPLKAKGKISDGPGMAKTCTKQCGSGGVSAVIVCLH